MPTIVQQFFCFLTFISMINTTSEIFKSRNVFICWYVRIYEQLKICAQLSLPRKKVLQPRGKISYLTFCSAGYARKGVLEAFAHACM